jgi:large subunit ribosomal protein L2
MKIVKFKSVKNLLKGLKELGGRNHSGKITVYQRGGGHKKLYRSIDFKRQQQEGCIVGFEYDPNRNTFLAKVFHKKNNTFFYILAPNGLKILDKVFSKKKSKNIIYQPGNTFAIKNIPVGTLVHNVELIPEKGGQLIRSAGTFAKILSSKKKNFVTIRLPSGEHRLIPLDCKATIGSLSNENWRYVDLKKAGRSRWLNKRPTVRGVAMNPIDHPHGGGEGKTSGGRPSVTPWGFITKGPKTRSKKKSNFFILKRRQKV